MKKALVFGVAVLLAIAAIAAIAVIAIGLLLWVQRDNPAAPMSPSDAAAELRRVLEAAEPSSLADNSAARAALANARRSQPNADWWDRPFSEVFGSIQAAAEAGDGQAAFALGSRSAWCMKVLRERNPEVLLSEYRRDMESIEVADDQKLTQARLTNTNNRFQRELELYEDCAALGEKRLSGHLSWLSRAPCGIHLPEAGWLGRLAGWNNSSHKHWA